MGQCWDKPDAPLLPAADPQQSVDLTRSGAVAAAEIKRLKEDNEQKDKRIAEMEQQSRKEIAQRDEQITQRDKQIAQLQQLLRQRDEQLAQMQQQQTVTSSPTLGALVPSAAPAAADEADDAPARPRQSSIAVGEADGVGAARS